MPKQRMMFANRRPGTITHNQWLHSRRAVYRWEAGVSGQRLRSPGYVLLAIVCVAIMGVMSMMSSAFMFGVKAIIAEAKLLANEGWIMSGTGVPTPDQDYINDVESL